VSGKTSFGPYIAKHIVYLHADRPAGVEQIHILHSTAMSVEMIPISNEDRNE